MRSILGTAVIMLGLVACTRTPEAGPTEAASPPSPAAPESALPTAETAPPPAESAPRGRIGGKCEYDDAPGIATVTAIEDEPPNGDCKHPKKVTLSFVADDPAAKPDPRDKAFPLVVGGASFVAAGCLEAYKLAVGTKLKTVRHIIKAGTCSPIVHEVTALSSEGDVNKCVGYCSK